MVNKRRKEVELLLLYLHYSNIHFHAEIPLLLKQHVNKQIPIKTKQIW